MELAELETRLVPFARAKYDDPHADIEGVHMMPGHAGFAYGFSVVSGGRTESWFLRLPPPNVKWEGTADVLRQVAVLRALDDTEVPHCSVKWAGDDLEWFGRPYFVVPKLEGDVVRSEPGEWTAALPEATRRNMAEQAMRALAAIHRMPHERLLQKLGDPIAFAHDVERWDRFMPKLARPEDFARAPGVREKLLKKAPDKAPVGVFHGDYHFANTFFSFDGQLLAVIDWELTGIGATLNDVGWAATFNDPPAWAHPTLPGPSGNMPTADELCEMYQVAWADTLPDIRWFRALAGYKFAIITGFNLNLHLRGKRTDPLWEEIGDSITTLLGRAEALLDEM